MKRKYDPAELEIIFFGMNDVITSSPGFPAPDDEEGGAIGGSGYDPNGWT